MAVSVQKHKQSDQEIVKSINEGDEAAFEKLFYEYYSDLCRMAFQIVNCRETAEDTVQTIFLNVWQSRKSWQINVSLKAYLYRAVKNRAINRSNKRKIRERVKRDFSDENRYSNQILENNRGDSSRALVKKIWSVAEAMPEKRQFVFTLHRKYGLTYKEISEVMGISSKTVENHMGLALKQIREEVKRGIEV